MDNVKLYLQLDRNLDYFLKKEQELLDEMDSIWYKLSDDEKCRINEHKVNKEKHE